MTLERRAEEPEFLDSEAEFFRLETPFAELVLRDLPVLGLAREPLVDLCGEKLLIDRLFPEKVVGQRLRGEVVGDN